MARFLIIVGVVFVISALCWPLLARLGLRRLPGDVIVERPRFKLYLPLTTSILISLALSFVLGAAHWLSTGN